MFGPTITCNLITCLDHLSPETCAKNSPGTKAFLINLWSLSPALRNLCNLQTLYFYIPVSSQLQLQAPFLCPEGVWSRQLSLQYYYLLFCHSHSFNPCLSCLLQIQLLYRCFKEMSLVKVIPQQDLSKLVAVLYSINRLWIHCHWWKASSSNISLSISLQFIVKSDLAFRQLPLPPK